MGKRDALDGICGFMSLKTFEQETAQDSLIVGRRLEFRTMLN